MSENAEQGAGRYDRAAAVLHWVIAVLFLLTTGLALFRETFAPYAVAMITAHKASGLLVLAAVLARLSLPLGRNRPSVGERWQRRLAGSVHRLILALLVLVPTAGWIFVSLAPPGRPFDYRGLSLVELPLSPDDDASFAWHEVHEMAGFALLGLFALHFAGLAFHQLRPGDSVLGPMLAGSRAASRLALLAFVLLAIWVVGLGLDFFDVRPWR